MVTVNVRGLDGRELRVETEADWSVKDLRAAVESQFAGSFKLFAQVPNYASEGHPSCDAGTQKSEQLLSSSFKCMCAT